MDFNEVLQAPLQIVMGQRSGYGGIIISLQGNIEILDYFCGFKMSKLVSFDGYFCTLIGIQDRKRKSLLPQGCMHMPIIWNSPLISITKLKFIGFNIWYLVVEADLRCGVKISSDVTSSFTAVTNTLQNVATCLCCCLPRSAHCI